MGALMPILMYPAFFQGHLKPKAADEKDTAMNSMEHIRNTRFRIIPSFFGFEWKLNCDNNN
jgi:hypothetical protein